MKRFLFIVIFVFSFLNANRICGQETDKTSLKSDPNSPIFEVKNDANQTVFAVYPGGVKIFIDDQLKAAGGGFTIGRLGTGKLTGDDFFVVNPGDVKVLLDTKQKAVGGGFTVGRLGTGKSSGLMDFLRVTPDSTRIYMNNLSNGFEVANLGTEKENKLINFSKHNVYIGAGAGGPSPQFKESDYNVCIGYQAGFDNEGSNKLIIGNGSLANQPLIYGDFSNMEIKFNAVKTEITGELIQPSDINLKTNVVKMTNGLQLLSSLNTYYFDWKEGIAQTYGFSDRHQIGLLAQEIELVLPELVSTGSNGYKAVDYIKLSPVLVRAVNEQQLIIENLQQRVENLEKQNENLHKEATEAQNLRQELEELKRVVQTLSVQMNNPEIK